MISLLGPFALTPRPYSWPRFALYMAGLAAIVAFNLAGERRAPNQAAAIVASKIVGESGVPHQATAMPAGDEAVIVRFPQSLEDTSGDLRQIGLPWFLVRQGATARREIKDDTTFDLEVSVSGKVAGRYEERLVSLGEGRSKLFVAFIPTDMPLVEALAAPIKTPLDPVSLFRVVMGEHIRSNVNGGGFDMNVLTDSVGSRFSVFRKAFGDSGLCQNPQSDDFKPCSQENEDANIRRAYREESTRPIGK